MRRKKIELTKGEEEIMLHIWNLKEATVNDIMTEMPEPKPKYTTIATFIKLLENKDYVDHYQMGKSYVFIPLVKKEAYAKLVVSSMLKNYFNGSLSNMVSVLAENDEISAEELEAIGNVIEGLKNK